MIVTDLHQLDYRAAWQKQEEAHARVLAGGEEEILLVEHTPVITFGRRAEDSARHLIASKDLLAKMGVEVVESDRGGDITFHGPGQLVVYPIVRLADHRLSVGGYVKALEHAVIRALSNMGISARLEPDAIGVWVDDHIVDPVNRLPSPTPAKICALGVRIKRGVSLHGIALNVTTDLSYFNLIVPCGLNGRPVTSMQNILREKLPSMNQIKQHVTESIIFCVDQNK